MIFFCNYQIESEVIRSFNVFKIYFKKRWLKYATIGGKGLHHSGSTCKILWRSNIAFYWWQRACQRWIDDVVVIDFFFFSLLSLFSLAKYKSFILFVFYIVWSLFFAMYLLSFVFFFSNFVSHHLVSFIFVYYICSRSFYFYLFVTIFLVEFYF
jgi:hypothetical protein